jgi:hypothetical protein
LFPLPPYCSAKKYGQRKRAVFFGSVIYPENLDPAVPRVYDERVACGAVYAYPVIAQKLIIAASDGAELGYIISVRIKYFYPCIIDVSRVNAARVFIHAQALRGVELAVAAA